MADGCAAAADVHAMELGVKRWGDRLDNVQGVVNIAPGLNEASTSHCWLFAGVGEDLRPGSAVRREDLWEFNRCQTLFRWSRPRN